MAVNRGILGLLKTPESVVPREQMVPVKRNDGYEKAGRGSERRWP